MNKRTYYYKNGQIRKNVHRISSVELKEEIKKTYDNGNNEYVVRYTNDIVKGATIDGKPIKRGDRVDLEKIWYYKNGCIEVAHYSKDGKKDYYKRFMNFITVQYYENGQIEVEMSKKRGFNTSKEKEPDGKYIYYYRNGQIKVEGNYISGNKEGLITYYYENGQIMKEENYKEETDFFGYKNGKFTYYYENGQVKEEGNWKSSMFYNQYMDRKVSEKKVGEWTSYNLDGSINKVETNHKKSSRKTNNTDYDKKGCQDAYGKWHSHMSTCATCGTSYCVEYLQYGEYCSQECCGAYEGLSPKCGY